VCLSILGRLKQSDPGFLAGNQVGSLFGCHSSLVHAQRDIVDVRRRFGRSIHSNSAVGFANARREKPWPRTLADRGGGLSPPGTPRGRRFRCRAPVPRVYVEVAAQLVGLVGRMVFASRAVATDSKVVISSLGCCCTARRRLPGRSDPRPKTRRRRQNAHHRQHHPYSPQFNHTNRSSPRQHRARPSSC
jgi:hypothetical protein